MIKLNSSTNQIDVSKSFQNFIIAEDHPCIMAQTVFKMKDVSIKEYAGFGTKNTAEHILNDLEDYLEDYDFSTNSLKTFIATFPSEIIPDEITFENKLWQQLGLIHELDNKPWDPTVSSDPDNHNFSFSILGHAFYMVGMHPNSSRKARRAPFTALVFNLHHQFEMLREMGTYKRVRNRIRKRDKKLQGSINPVLADFGNSSEAMQYSGKDNSKEWKCPFHSKSN